jgi:hypothetical protein
MSARVGRATSNALKVDLQVEDGVIAAHARQKGSVGVLLGFKNGGKASYTLEAKGVHLDIDVAATTSVSRAGAPLGKIVGLGSSARIDDVGGTVLAEINPHQGAKSDDAFVHRLTTPAGASLGELTLMRTSAGWHIIDDVLDWAAGWYVTTTSLKAPSAGATLKLDAPVPDVLGDLLCAALVDACVPPRGYVA